MTDGADLTRYPHPHVAVDIAVLTVLPDARSLGVLVLTDSRTGRLVLPGRFIREGRTVEQTVDEVLLKKCDLAPRTVRPRLLAVFSDPSRDSRAWTMSVAHVVALPTGEVADRLGDFERVDLAGRLASRRTFAYDHADIVRAAATDLRDRYETVPDPEGLLDGPFTLSELRHVHESVLGERLSKDTFKRRMLRYLEEAVGDGGVRQVRRTAGRPAQLYGKRPEHQVGTPRWRLPRA